MLRLLLVSVTWCVPPAYAGMCSGALDGTVTCTEEIGRNSTLESLDHALVSPGGVTAGPDYSLTTRDMATYPKETKTDLKPVQPPSDTSKESLPSTFITPGTGLTPKSR